MQIRFVGTVNSNSAAWLLGPGVRPLEVKSAPPPEPSYPGSFLIVKVGAVAVNPVDVEAQSSGTLFQRHALRVGTAAFNRLWAAERANWHNTFRREAVRATSDLLRAVFPKTSKACKKYPCLLGCDLAGEVVQVGWSGFKPGGIRVGDRVLGLALAAVTLDSTPADFYFNLDTYPFEKAFQEYALVRHHLACVIPDTISYEQACVLPLTMAIAANALFHEDYLELCRPTIPPREPDASSDIVIITAGASSLGCHAIQLACAAGYWVYSTASPGNFKTVHEFGAKRVFDSRTRNLAGQILLAMREDNRRSAGAVAIGIDSVETCRKVLGSYKGGNGLRDNNKFVAFTELPVEVRPPSNPVSVASRTGSAALRKLSNTVHSRVYGVQIKPIALHKLGSWTNKITVMLFRDFLPRALASDQYSPAPQPKVVGKGLDKIQEAFDVVRDEVSAEKVVVSM